MSKKVKYWSGKPTDPEQLNYTAEAFREVFMTPRPNPVFEKGYPSYEAVNREHSEKPENDST